MPTSSAQAQDTSLVEDIKPHLQVLPEIAKEVIQQATTSVDSTTQKSMTAYGDILNDLKSDTALAHSDFLQIASDWQDSVISNQQLLLSKPTLETVIQIQRQSYVDMVSAMTKLTTLMFSAAHKTSAKITQASYIK